MLSPTLDTLRLSLHVLAATVWVGGQITLAGLVPAVRRFGPDATGAIARAFARVAWPAFALLVITGLWNLTAVDLGNTDTAYQVTVMIKITVAILSGLFVAIHSVGRSKVSLVVGGALGLVCSLAALYLGVLLSVAR